MELVPLVLLSPLLIWVALTDLMYMRIPNYLVVAGFVLFLVCAPFLPWESVLYRVAAAAIVFAIGFVVFALRMFGGGDVKILTVLMLFVPPTALPLFGFVFSLSMLVGVGVILAARASPWAATSSWVSLQSPGVFPMGISISLSGLALPWVIAAIMA